MSGLEHRAKSPLETSRPEFTVGRGEVKLPVVDEHNPNPLDFFHTFWQINGDPLPEGRVPSSGNPFKDKVFTREIVVPAGGNKPEVRVRGEYRYVGDEEGNREIFDVYTLSRTQGYETHRATVAPTEKAGPPDEVVAVRREDRSGLPASNGADTTVSIHGVELSAEDPEELKAAQVKALHDFRDLVS